MREYIIALILSIVWSFFYLIRYQAGLYNSLLALIGNTLEAFLLLVFFIVINKSLGKKK